MLKKILFMLMFLPALGLADEPLGQKLVERLWKDMQAKNVEKIKEYTSVEFQAIIFSSGNVLNRYEELDGIKSTTILSYSLSDITATQGENIIVVTYKADVDEIVDSVEGTSSGPYITVWKKFDDERWKWIAQADLSTVSVVPPFSPS